MALQVFPKIPNLDACMLKFNNQLFYYLILIILAFLTANIENDDNSEEELDVEDEINKFENLLSQMMQFRPNTENMSREDRLNHAQNFAEIFEKLILQDAEEDESVPNN